MITLCQSVGLVSSGGAGGYCLRNKNKLENLPSVGTVHPVRETTQHLTDSDNDARSGCDNLKGEHQKLYLQLVSSEKKLMPKSPLV